MDIEALKASFKARARELGIDPVQGSTEFQACSIRAGLSRDAKSDAAWWSHPDMWSRQPDDFGIDRAERPTETLVVANLYSAALVMNGQTVDPETIDDVIEIEGVNMVQEVLAEVRASQRREPIYSFMLDDVQEQSIYAAIQREQFEPDPAY